MQHIPTAPVPSTTTDDPRSTLAALMTEPYPVMTQHPNVAAVVNGISISILTTAACGTTVTLDIVPSPKLVSIARPRWTNLSIGTTGLFSHTFLSPRRHEKHSP